MPLWKDHRLLTAEEITIAEAADLLGINRVRAWRIIKARPLPHRYITPKLVAVDRAAVERLAATERRRGRPRKDRNPTI